MDPQTQQSTLEVIAICASVGGLLSTMIVGYGVLENALSVHKGRKRIYESQQRGVPKKNYNIPEEPKFRTALKDSLKFSMAYIKSLGKTNTSNWDFNKRYKVNNEFV